MSHFSVMVIGDDPEKQLAPYHEFECTGVNDEHVVEVDQTDEARQEYEADTETLYRNTTTGQLESCYNDKGNYREGWYEEKPHDLIPGHTDKRLKVPEGFVAEEVNTKDHKSFQEWASGYYGRKVVPHGGTIDRDEDHKYGYIQLAEDGTVAKVIDRTNPRKRWDWYVLGGRFSQRLKLLPGHGGQTGEPGVGALMHPERYPRKEGYADVAQKQAIDWHGMAADAEREGRALYRKWHSIVAPHEMPQSWEHMREVVHKGNIEAARKAYHDQPAIKALNASEEFKWWWGDLVGEFTQGEENYAELCRLRSIPGLAFVKDSQWFEQGTMGWWGVVHDETDEREWKRRIQALLDATPPDTLISIYDCHI